MKVHTLPSCDTGERRGSSGSADGDNGDTRNLEVNHMNSTLFLLSLLQIAGTMVEGKNEVRDWLEWRELLTWQ